MRRRLAGKAGLVGRALFIGIVEFIAFGRMRLVRSVLHRILARPIFAIRAHFEPGFYISQIKSPRRSRSAQRDPLLHYLIIGWTENRAPNKRLDPRFVKDEVGCGHVKGEPLARLLCDKEFETTPQNEVEACANNLRAASTFKKRALIFHHARGGGSSKYLALFEAELRRQDIQPIRLRLLPQNDRIVIWASGAEPPLSFDLVTDFEALVAAAAAASIGIVLVSHLIDFHPDIKSRIATMGVRLNADMWIVLHDYFALCPRVNLVTSDGRCCSVPPSQACVRCVAEGGSDIGGADPATWRGSFLSFLRTFDRVLVPSDEMRRRMAAFTDVAMEVWSPESDKYHPDQRNPVLQDRENLRVGILGNLSVAKGSLVTLALARHIRKTDMPLEVILYGQSDIAAPLRREGVEVLGRYREHDLKSLILKNTPHVILLPAIWPETWSFVLTTALELGLPVMAFAHGAQFERLQAMHRTDQIIPLDLIDRPDLLCLRLLEFRKRCLVAGDGG